MIEAFVLVQVDVTVGRMVGDEIARVPGVLLAHVVTGPYDVVVRVEADSMDLLGALIGKIQRIPGVTRTLTCPVIRI
ncbi:MAG: Lrp/AsnC family transcriptional regulator [Actinomycetota bacterium]